MISWPSLWRRMMARWRSWQTPLPSGPWFLGLLIVFVAFVVNGMHPVLRFTSPLLNHLVFSIAMMLPLVLLSLSFFLPRLWIKAIAAIGLLSVVPVASFLALFALSDASSIAGRWEGQDRSFELVERVPLDHSHLSVYRTNGGATTSFGIVVRQEMPLLRGLRLVKNVYRAYPAHDVAIAVLDGHRLRITGPPYGGNEPYLLRDEIQIRPFVYF